MNDLTLLGRSKVVTLMGTGQEPAEPQVAGKECRRGELEPLPVVKLLNAYLLNHKDLQMVITV